MWAHSPWQTGASSAPCSSLTESYIPPPPAFRKLVPKAPGQEGADPQGQEPWLPPSCWGSAIWASRAQDEPPGHRSAGSTPGPRGAAPVLGSASGLPVAPGGPQSSAPGKARGLSFPRRSRAGFRSRLWGQWVNRVGARQV